MHKCAKIIPDTIQINQIKSRYIKKLIQYLLINKGIGIEIFAMVESAMVLYQRMVASDRYDEKFLPRWQ